MTMRHVCSWVIFSLFPKISLVYPLGVARSFWHRSWCHNHKKVIYWQQLKTNSNIQIILKQNLERQRSSTSSWSISIILGCKPGTSQLTEIRSKITFRSQYYCSLGLMCSLTNTMVYIHSQAAIQTWPEWQNCFHSLWFRIFYQFWKFLKGLRTD